MTTNFPICTGALLFYLSPNLQFCKPKKRDWLTRGENRTCLSTQVDDF